MAEPIASLRLGIVGANATRGWAKDAHLPAIMALPEVAVAAIAARGAELADEAAAVFGAVRAYGDAQALIDDPDVDIVMVAVRVPEHRAVVLAALAAGKDVYCEWPLGRDLAEAEEVAAAVPPGRHALIGAQGLSAPAVRRTIELIRAGAIGRPKVLRAFNSAAAWGTSVPAQTYLQDKASGATLATIGMGHMLAAIDAMVGPYLAADARSTVLHQHIAVADSDAMLERSCEDHILALGLHESGCVSTLEVIGGMSLHTALIEVVGEDGWLRVRGTAPGTYQIAPLVLEGSMPLEPLPPRVSPELTGASANLAEVYDRLVRDRRSLPDFADAVRLTRVIEAIDRASSTGQRQFLAPAGILAGLGS